MFVSCFIFSESKLNIVFVKTISYPIFTSSLTFLFVYFQTVKIPFNSTF